MPVATQAIQTAKDDEFYVSISAHIQSFQYEITLYEPDGNGGLQNGKSIGFGNSSHQQRIGSGADIAGARVEVCVTHGGQTETSQYEIVVRLIVERTSRITEDVKTWRIRPGLASGDYSCMMLAFK